MATRRGVLILALCLATLAVISLVYAQGGFDLSWWTVDGGGGTSSGGDYALTGTAGQAEVGALMQGGAYELAGGFWGAAAQAEYDLYLPAVMRAWP
jgi:hypothetical protein